MTKPELAPARVSAPQRPSRSAAEKLTFKTDLIALIPFLRAFSRSLCMNRTLAEDMAQIALVKAWSAQASFEPGTNLKAWLFTILRNEFMTDRRRSWRQSHWDEAESENIPAPPDEQEWSLQMSDVERAMRCLPEQQREAVILIGAGGVTYEEASLICDVPVGTIKSRVARGRSALIDIMDGVAKRPVARAESGRAMNNILAQLGALTREPSGSVRDLGNAAAPG